MGINEKLTDEELFFVYWYRERLFNFWTWVAPETSLKLSSTTWINGNTCEISFQFLWYQDNNEQNERFSERVIGFIFKISQIIDEIDKISLKVIPEEKCCCNVIHSIEFFASKDGLEPLELKVTQFIRMTN